MRNIYYLDQIFTYTTFYILTVATSYNSKVTAIGALHAKKIVEAVLHYVFKILFPAALLLTIEALLRYNPREVVVVL